MHLRVRSKVLVRYRGSVGYLLSLIPLVQAKKGKFIERNSRGHRERRAHRPRHPSNSADMKTILYYSLSRLLFFCLNFRAETGKCFVSSTVPSSGMDKISPHIDTVSSIAHFFVLHVMKRAACSFLPPP